MADKFAAVLDQIDLLVLEAKRLRALGPAFQIYHRSQGVGCCPGEELLLITLPHRSREFIVHLTTGPMLAFDFLWRTRRPQRAAQLAIALARDPFSTQHAPMVS